MAQHDMNIANQGFPAFRADLNDALGALVSNSSGATAPSTTFAHQFWVDTAADPSILKIRNADNDAWITIGEINQTDDKFKLTPADGVSTDTISELTSAAGVTVDGVLLKDSQVSTDQINEKTSATGVTIDGVLLKDSGVVTGAGTVSAPVYSTTGDLNTGIFFPAADNIGFATGGTIRGRWTTDGLCFGSDTAAANALDDYEEGDWTVQLQDSNGNNAVMEAGFSTGTYVKIGRQVTITGTCYTSSISGLSGNVRISGLPFAIGNGDKFRGAGATSNEQLLNITSGQKPSLQIVGNRTNINFYISNSAGGGAVMSTTEWSSDGLVAFTATYFVD